MEQNNMNVSIGYDEELGGWAIKDEHGSFILFKDGSIHIRSAKQIFLNYEEAAEFKDAARSKD
jgi:hypothetical protein